MKHVGGGEEDRKGMRGVEESGRAEKRGGRTRERESSFPRKTTRVSYRVTRRISSRVILS